VRSHFSDEIATDLSKTRRWSGVTVDPSPDLSVPFKIVMAIATRKDGVP